MIKRTLCVPVLLFLAPACPADITLLGSASFPGNATDQSGLSGEVAPGVPANVLGSHGSGIAWTGAGQTFLMVADRGPLDGATPFRCRWHTIEFTVDDAGTVGAAPRCIATTLLSDERGRPFIGDAAAIDSGDDAKALRLDPEAIRVGPDGTVYVAEEYGPSVLAFAPEGRLLRRLPIPDKFLCKHPAAGKAAELPPANTSGRVPNHGFEGLATVPGSGRLYGIVQGPLIQDGALDGRNKPAGTNVRILELNADEPGATPREFLYQLDSPRHCVNEILAVNSHEFLVIERDEAAGAEAKSKRIVRIDIAGASDIAAVPSLPAKGAPEGVRPVSKTALIDLLDSRFGLGGPRMPAKIEGLAFGPDLKDGRHVLMVTSDNDVKPQEPTWVWVFALDDKDLPGFASQRPNAK